MDLLNDERTVGRGRPAPSARESASPGFPDSRTTHFFAPPRHFDPANPELIDRPDTDPALLREELTVLENVNRRGGHALVLRSLERLLPPTRVGPLSILDLGTGAADYPRAIAAWARQRGLPVAITAVDRNPQVLDLAREWCRDWPEIRLEQHDLLALPYAAESFDVVMCSNALHHFDAEDAVTILRRMQELARVGFILHDLRRNWPAIWAMELVARTFIKSGIARHDAVQSCRAAFTVDELSALARRAGLRNFHIRRSPTDVRHGAGGAEMSARSAGRIASVAIVGGGPTASTLATLLARAGVRVAILHQPKTVPLIVGESLVPAIIPMLRMLGVEEQVKSFSRYKPGAAININDKVNFSFPFDKLRSNLPQYAYNVPRDRFDATLAGSRPPGRREGVRDGRGRGTRRRHGPGAVERRNARGDRRISFPSRRI